MVWVSGLAAIITNVVIGSFIRELGCCGPPQFPCGYPLIYSLISKHHPTHPIGSCLGFQLAEESRRDRFGSARLLAHWS